MLLLTLLVVRMSMVSVVFGAGGGSRIIGHVVRLGVKVQVSIKIIIYMLMEGFTLHIRAFLVFV